MNIENVVSLDEDRSCQFIFERNIGTYRKGDKCRTAVASHEFCDSHRTAVSNRKRRSDSIARHEDSLATKTRRMDSNVKNRERVAERSRRCDHKTLRRQN